MPPSTPKHCVIGAHVDFYRTGRLGHMLTCKVKPFPNVYKKGILQAEGQVSKTCLFWKKCTNMDEYHKF
jgi:hypothetical protein